MMSMTVRLTSILAVLFCLGGCGNSNTSTRTEHRQTTVKKTPVTSTRTVSAAATGPRVRMETSAGIIELQLNKEKAPETVNNFISYVKSGFYNGTVFHRIIDGFMIQGGGFAIDVNKKQFYRKRTRPAILNEASNGLKNARGTIAMARTDDPDSATSQFFINVNNNVALDYRNDSAGYCVFGHVTGGMKVVDKIAKMKTGQGDWPIDQVVIKSVTLIE